VSLGPTRTQALRLGTRRAHQTAKRSDTYPRTMPGVFEQTCWCDNRQGCDLQRVAGPLGALSERLECGVTKRAKATKLPKVPHRFRNARTSSHTQGQTRLATWLTIRSLRRSEGLPSVRPEAWPKLRRGSRLPPTGTGRAAASCDRAVRPTLSRPLSSGDLATVTRTPSDLAMYHGARTPCRFPRFETDQKRMGYHGTDPRGRRRPSGAASVITCIPSDLLVRRCARCPGDRRRVRGRSIDRSGQAFESLRTSGHVSSLGSSSRRPRRG
jgi:hypothetical protein